MSESADKQWDFGLGIHKAEGIKEAAVIFEPGEFRRRFRHVEITCQHGQTGASPISHDVADAVDLVPAGTCPEGYLHVLDAFDQRDRPISPSTS